VRILLFILFVFYPTIVYGEVIFGANGNFVNGKSDSEMYKTSIDVELDYSKTQTYISSSYFKQRTNNEDIKNRFEVKLKEDFKYSDKLSPFISEYYKQDQAEGLKYDNKFGAGLKYYLIKRDSFRYLISYASLYQSLKYELSESEIEYRHSFRSKLKLKYSKFNLTGLIFYQPKMSESNDYITNSKIELDFKINKIMLFNMLFENEYRSKSIYSTETIFMFGIKVVIP